MNNKIKYLILGLLTLVMMIACDGGKMEKLEIEFPKIKDVPAPAWGELSQKTIYFGHKSVGNNIIDGIEQLLKDSPQINLNIVKVTDGANFEKSVFAHSEIGKNSDPQSKLDAFENILKRGVGRKIDIAFLKFCFDDINSATDVKKLIADYRNKMASLASEFPGITFVHFTVPLLKKENPSVISWLKGLFSKDDGYFANSHNIARNEVNELLRKEYAGKKLLFDIAMIQSTYPDGRREIFKENGKSYYSLVPDYTGDGGHLNETGSRKVAEQLIVLLSNIR